MGNAPTDEEADEFRKLIQDNRDKLSLNDEEYKNLTE